jgi:outer membrane receptor protein involved in Fe transport
VVVYGDSPAARLRRSVHAVEVVELTREKERSADLGEVLARSTTLRVQREGGLGSAARYSLNGLSGERVRFFLDGVPLELSGYELGIANVPLNLVDRVELYQGVVPVQFGADALGGAVNLVTDNDLRSNRAGGSYELGSFGTHRLSLSGRRYFPELGAVVRGSAFFDSAANDYPVDVEVFDQNGRPRREKLRRFHDGYRGSGVSVGAGLLDQGWADRLLLQGFVADYAREIQHNPAMTVPYGEVTYDRRTAGGSARYAKRLSDAARIEATLGYAFRRARLRDLSRCRYDWYGRCFIELPLRGEIESLPTDRRVDEQTAFARVLLSFTPLESHALRLSLAPTEVWRTGADREIAREEEDPLRAERRLSRQVVGLEYEIRAGALSALTFAKIYRDSPRSERRLPTGAVEHLNRHSSLLGVGDSLRLALGKAFSAKLSYEYAARFPTPDELFGDGGLVVENLELSAERSHNYNLAFMLEPVRTPVGEMRGTLTTALRRVENLILPLNRGSYYEHDNVLSAQTLAVDARAGYTSPLAHFGVDGSLGLEDVRNTSETGPGARFEGDRIPNMPYVRAGAAAFVRGSPALLPRDRLELAWNLRYVGAFFLGWESAGKDEIKLEIPSQTVHALALAYAVASRDSTLTSAFEVQNLTDAPAFDFYGVPRPGRSFHLKMTIDHQ